jgi:predicted component of type VI protein secretion system
MAEMLASRNLPNLMMGEKICHYSVSNMKHQTNVNRRVFLSIDTTNFKEMTHKIQVGVLYYHKIESALEEVSQNIPLRLLFISEKLSIV